MKALRKTPKTHDEWYTPKDLIDRLGTFDLDPACAIRQAGFKGQILALAP